MFKLEGLHSPLPHETGAPAAVPHQNPPQPTVREQDIAVIGMALRVPQADDLEAFWRIVTAGAQSVRSFPPERKRAIEQYLSYVAQSADPAERDYLTAAYLHDVAAFDYQFFRFSPREASLLSPDQRLFLSTAWAAIEDAGYGGKQLVGTRTGVYCGYVSEAGGAKYREMLFHLDGEQHATGIPGNLASIIPSRLSYLLDLRGPSMIVDTACSSSLVAVHLACRALRDGECDQAIVGGVRTDLIPLDLLAEKLGTESPDGYTRTYDDAANGSGLGEGVGAVLLKPLAQALADGDAIYAVIKGSALNQDGTSIGITAPNAEAQADVIVRAWKNAEVHPDTIGYLEAHGTATPLGDVVEMEGLQKAFARFTTRKQFCAIGSVKTNIGHLYQSAGIVGLIKATLALHKRQLPPTILFRQPNRRLALADSPVYVNTRLKRWSQPDGHPRRAAVSSWGLSGTNCHLILEEAPVPSKKAAADDRHHVLTLSGGTQAVLQQVAARYLAYLQQETAASLADICFTANTGRSHLAHRAVLFASTRQELLERLAALTDGRLVNRDGLWTGSFKVVPNDKESCQAGELTEQAQRDLSRAVQEHWGAGRLQDALAAICQLYVRGADVEWERLYRGQEVQRVHLPTYPYQQTSCWLTIPDVQRATHPYYDLAWCEDDSATEGTFTPTGAVLILLDSQGVGQQVADELRRRGQDVITVASGSHMQQLATDHYVIGDAEADYDALLTALSNRSIGQVLHLMALDEHRPDSLAELTTSQRRGVFSLFYLTRALLRSHIRHTVDLVLIGRNVHAVTGRETALHPEVSPLFGLGKVVAQEYPELACRAIDLDENVDVHAFLRTLSARNHLYTVALRDGRRYAERFVEVELPTQPTTPPEVRAGGLYLITGGLGGMGLEVAKHLVSKQKITLALVSRTALPPRDRWGHVPATPESERVHAQIRSIRELEALGAQVVLYSADVAQEAELAPVLADLKAHYGPLHGIIHCAGVAGNGFLIRKDEDVFANVLAPKIYGTWLLDRLTAAEPLDFFITFSSAAAMIGEPGLGDYTAANAYLDTFATARRRVGRTALSINWVVWKEVGMGVAHGFGREGLLFHLLPTAQAMQAFDQLLAHDVTRVLVGELNFDSDMLHILEQPTFHLSPAIQAALTAHQQRQQRPQPAAGSAGLAGLAAPPLRPSADDVQLAGKEEGHYTETERAIGQTCRDILGFREINVYDSFFELGADSLLLKKMHAVLEARFPGRVTVADLFAHTSVVKLARHLDGGEDAPVEAGADQEADELSRLLDNVGRGDVSMEDALKSLRGF